MTPLLFAVAALAGGAGAVVRYLVDRGVARLVGARFPWGVFLINVSGSFALGWITAQLPSDATFVLGAGFLGGYTTFSTAMLDVVALWRDGERGAALFHSAGMLVAGILAAVAGLATGAALR